jgi:hypothetical protein
MIKKNNDNEATLVEGLKLAKKHQSDTGDFMLTDTGDFLLIDPAHRSCPRVPSLIPENC